MRSRYKLLAAVLPLGVALLASACSSASAGSPASSGSSASGSSAAIVAVGAENEYANVIQQVGGNSEVFEGRYGAGWKGVVPVRGRVGKGGAESQTQDRITYPSV
jgi:hypothetical protein